MDSVHQKLWIALLLLYCLALTGSVGILDPAIQKQLDSHQLSQFIHQGLIQKDGGIYGAVIGACLGVWPTGNCSWFSECGEIPAIKLVLTRILPLFYIGIMSGDYDEDRHRKAMELLHVLCSNTCAAQEREKCQELTGHVGPINTEILVSLLSVIVTFCGIVLLGVSLFVSWKLCWIPWRDKGSSSQTQRKEHPLHAHLHHSPFGDLLAERVELGPEMPERSYLDMDSYPEANLKVSQTSPDLPVESQTGTKEGSIPNAHSHQQVASLAPTPRYNTLPRPVTQQLSSPDTGVHGGVEDKVEQVTSIGQIKPELYKQRSGEADSKKGEAPSCGQLSFALRYAYGTEQLVVRILRALDLPAKDANGFSDPYVKMYLLPDRKKKFQTKVHRKTLNPIFNETFNFNVPFAELPSRKLHFSVYDFDRFSRHDLIGQVVLDNLLEIAERDNDAPLWRDIMEASSEKADLGELNFSLCYLPTAGRLTVTIIKATNLKAMDLTGFSDPYVKASLMCEGRRLKKRKTSIKKNTLNPSYNEALVFDIPQDSMEHVSITLAVMDYDCIGHNEVIGMCRVGNDADAPGRDHWAEMLANPRKPIEHWHQLVEEKTLNSYINKNPPARDKPSIIVESVHSD